MAGEEARSSRLTVLFVDQEEEGYYCAQICQHLQLEAALGISFWEEMARDWAQANLPLLQDETSVMAEVVVEHLVDHHCQYCYPCVAG